MNWKRPWIPLLLWVGLIACFLDSRSHRARCWVGYWKIHVACSHHRGVLTVTLFYEGYAPGGVDFQAGAAYEPLPADSWTSRHWPTVIGPLQANRTPAWELRVPTLFLVGTFPPVWWLARLWRERYRRSRLQKEASAALPP